MATQGEQQVWTLSNTVMAAMGGLILILLTGGFWSINNKIDSGDTATSIAYQSATRASTCSPWQVPRDRT